MAVLVKISPVIPSRRRTERTPTGRYRSPVAKPPSPSQPFATPTFRSRSCSRSLGNRIRCRAPSAKFLSRCRVDSKDFGPRLPAPVKTTSLMTSTIRGHRGSILLARGVQAWVSSWMAISRRCHPVAEVLGVCMCTHESLAAQKMLRVKPQTTREVLQNGYLPPSHPSSFTSCPHSSAYETPRCGLRTPRPHPPLH